MSQRSITRGGTSSTEQSYTVKIFLGRKKKIYMAIHIVY